MACNNGNLFPFGCYTNSIINYSDRLKILKSANDIYNRGTDVKYEWNDVLIPSDWDDTINGIQEMRCDGLIEVCYEMHNINTWGKTVGGSTHYNIKDNSYEVEHNDFDWSVPDSSTVWADTLMPATQCGKTTPVGANTAFSKQDLCYPIGHKGGN